MKFAVVGAGSIGGFLGTLLSAAGEEVTFIARGANLDAIRRNGMKVILEDGSEVSARGTGVCATLTEAGHHDVVLLTVKAHQVAAVAAELRQVCDDDTAIVTMQNGIPWWYFQRHSGPYAGTPIRAVDPDGLLASRIDPAHIIGCVVYPAATLVEPGVVQVVEGRRFTLGELDGARSARVQAIAASFTRAGFKAPITSDIRSEIWLKLWGNLTFNPISALTHATLEELCSFPGTRELSMQCMREAESIANKLGITFRVSIAQRIAGAQKVGAHKTSMLRDVEQGKPLELEALLGSVLELGRLTDTATPHIDALYALTSLLANTLAAQSGKLIITGARS